jgi:MFS family permease
MVILMAPLLVFVKPRLPVPAASTVRPINIGFLKQPLFWVLQSFNIVQGTGYFLPPNYLPSYARSLGLNAQFGSLLLVMINAASVMGCILVGLLMDRSSVSSVILAISVGAAAAVLAVWGVSTSIAPLLVFSVLYGLTAGSYSTSWTGMIKDIKERSSTADANVVFGFLAAGRGIGSVVSGPLSEALISTSNLQDTKSLGYGSAYGSLIIFSGCTALVGGSSWLVRKVGTL